MISIGYDDLTESILLLLVKIWFDGFIAYILKFEIKGLDVSFKQAFSKSITIFPRLFVITLFAQLLMLPSILTAMLIGSTDPTGILPILSIVSAIVLFVWFSLIIPVAVIDETIKVIQALRRSRFLVHRYFFIILALVIISSLPSLALVDVTDNNKAVHSVVILLYLSTMIMSSLTILFAYMHLKVVKGETFLEENSS